MPRALGRPGAAADRLGNEAACQRPVGDRHPVEQREFLVDDRFGIQPAVGGGNFLILGRDQRTTLAAATAAVAAMAGTPGAILPFPGGVVRSGSKPSSRYKFLHASSNDAFCPTLRGIAARTDVPDGVGCVLELTTQDNRIVRVMSPADSAVTNGNLCIKGRFGFVHVQGA